MTARSKVMATAWTNCSGCDCSNCARRRNEKSLTQLMERVWTEGAARFETTHLRKDGSTFAVEGSSRRIDLEGAVYCLDILRDVTERKRLEANCTRLKNSSRSASWPEASLITLTTFWPQCSCNWACCVSKGTWIGKPLNPRACRIRCQAGGGPDPANCSPFRADPPWS